MPVIPAETDGPLRPVPAGSPGAAPGERRLTRLLFAVYLVLVAYASLYPFSGWRVPDVSDLAFITAPLPRFLSAFDGAANVLGYVPLGFLYVLLTHRPGPDGRHIAAATGIAALLSVVLESLQSFLPMRVASNVDLACNVLGAAAGAALGQRFAARILAADGPVRGWRERTFRAGAVTDVGLVLLGLWLFTQLNPAMLLFGAGDLRDLFAIAAGPGYRAGLFITIEMLTTAANLVAAAMLLAEIAEPAMHPRFLIVALVALALTVKTAAIAILMEAHNVLAWFTPGAQLGLGFGIAFALLALRLPRTGRLVLAATLLMAATALVNLAPSNPYLAATLAVWRQGHFLNFNGLTRVVASVWPFIALGYLILLASRAPDRR